MKLGKTRYDYDYGIRFEHSLAAKFVSSKYMEEYIGNPMVEYKEFSTCGGNMPFFSEKVAKDTSIGAAIILNPIGVDISYAHDYLKCSYNRKRFDEHYTIIAGKIWVKKDYSQLDLFNLFHEEQIDKFIRQLKKAKYLESLIFDNCTLYTTFQSGAYMI